MKFLPKAISILTLFNLTAISANVLADSPNSPRQCLIDICGGESNYLGTSARGSFGDLIPQNVGDYETKFVLPRLNQIVTKQAALQLSELDAAPDLIQKASVDQLSSTQLADIMLSSIPALYRSQFNGAVSQGKGENELTVNAAILKSKLPQLDPAKLDKFVVVENTFLQQKDFQTSLTLSNIPPYILRYSVTKSAGTEAEKQDLWNKQIDDEFTDVKQNQAEIHNLLYTKAELKLLAKARDISKLNSFEQSQVTALITKIQRHTAIRSPEVIAAVKDSGLTLADILELMDWSNKSKAIRAVLSSDDMINKSKLAVQKNCLPIVTRAFAAAPSQFRIDKMTELLTKVKTAAKSAARDYFTGASLEVALDAVDGAQFQYPSSNLNLRSETLIAFDNTLRKQKEISASLTAADFQTSQWKNNLVYMLTNISTATEESAITDARAVCSTLEPSFFEDKTLAEIKLIQVGWQSIAFPELGAGVLSHEIGHVVSKAVQNANSISTATAYISARQCSAGNHRAFEPSAIGRNFAQFAEEDWADVFSVKAMSYLKDVWPYSKNMACALVHISDTKIYDGFNLFISGTSDIHSTGAYRVMQTEVNSGRTLPKSCSAGYPSSELSAATHVCGK